MKRLNIDNELVGALVEISVPTLTWQQTADVFLRGSIAEFWQNACQGSGLNLDRYRGRVRAFMREGDTLQQAIIKARQA